MVKRGLVLIAGATGYVLGARAGRERYEQIVAAARKVRNDPRVQDAASTVHDRAAEAAPVVKEKAAAAAEDAVSHAQEAAGRVKGKVSEKASRSGDDDQGAAIPGTAEFPAGSGHA